MTLVNAEHNLAVHNILFYKCSLDSSSYHKLIYITKKLILKINLVMKQDHLIILYSTQPILYTLASMSLHIHLHYSVYIIETTIT